MTATLGLMLKFPVPGQVKTRLGRHIGIVAGYRQTYK